MMHRLIFTFLICLWAGWACAAVPPYPSPSTPLTGNEIFICFQGGVTKDCTVANVLGGGPYILNAPLTLQPNNAVSALNETATESGSTTLFNLNFVNVTSDTMNCAFCVDFYVVHDSGGAAARGARVGVYGNEIQTVANSGTGTTAEVGIAGIGQSNVGDGGTGLSNALVKGTYFGGNTICRNSGTNIQECAGLESDSETQTASTARYTFAFTAVNYEAVQGSSLDAAYAIYSGGTIPASGGAGPWGPGVGFHCGICFAELSANGLVPLDSGATVMGSHLESLSNIPAATGIDLTGFVFSGNAFQSNGFAVKQSGAFGYVAGVGAGGAVTQLTSRTTGVLINTPTGAITLFTAAGSATPATFTVTDSAVAATDTIVLNEKSGTNLYEFFVTAVGTGSFNVTFFTTGGTSSDAPVLNFSIVKGAAS